MMVLNLQSISKGCFWLPLKWLFSPRLPLPHALCWGAHFPAWLPSFGSGHAGTGGRTSHHTLTHGWSWDGAVADRGCTVTSWPQHWPQVFTLLQPQLGPLELVSIREKQCFHDNICGSCWLGFPGINMSSQDSPAVPQGLGSLSWLATGPWFVCGWCEGLPGSGVRVTPLCDCTFTVLWAA